MAQDPENFVRIGKVIIKATNYSQLVLSPINDTFIDRTGLLGLLRLEHGPRQIVHSRAACPRLHFSSDVVQGRDLLLGDMDPPLVDRGLVYCFPRVPPA